MPLCSKVVADQVPLYSKVVADQEAGRFVSKPSDRIVILTKLAFFTFTKVMIILSLISTALD